MPVSLLRRALTAVELRKKLLGKRFSPNAVEAVINKFQREYVVNNMKTVELLFISHFEMHPYLKLYLLSDEYFLNLVFPLCSIQLNKVRIMYVM